MLRKSIILAIVLVAIGLTGLRAQDSENIAQGNNLEEKMEWLKLFAKNNARYIVEFNEDESFSILRLGSLRKKISVTFRGIGANRTLKVTSIFVDGDTQLILDNNITISPRTNSDRTNSLITVGEDGYLVMNNGSTITGVSFFSNGGAVNVNRGTFTMNGGTSLVIPLARALGFMWMDAEITQETLL